MVLFPLALFCVLGMEPPNYPQLWQCVGMIVGVYGVGYAAAATDPVRHWPVVLAGLLSKVLGPTGFLSTVSDSEAVVLVGTSETIFQYAYGPKPHAGVVDGQARIRYAFCFGC